MDSAEKKQELMTALEDFLVKEFRVLQTLLNLSREERQALTKNDAMRLVTLTEEKEAILDELGQLDEGRKTVSESLAVMLAVPASTLTALFPHLESAAAERLGRLSEGITTLIQQSKEINQGNQALAAYKIEYLDAAQAYLLDLVQPPVGYYPSGKNYANQWTPSVEGDHRV